MRPAFVSSALLWFAPCALVHAAFVPASDPAFHFEGRIDARDPAAPVLVWQASEVDVAFTGRSLALHFGPAGGQNFFDASVDGATAVIALPAQESSRQEIPVGGSATLHRLRLYKRSEASAGTAVFLGLELADGEAVRPLPPPAPRLRFEFIGDSITAGACNEDPGDDQWESRRTHNAARSYAALTAAAFRAAHRNIAVSGMGICVGYVPVTAGQVWDRMEPSPAAPRADLRRDPPDVVFVNFGENDGSYSARHGMPFPAAFSQGYAHLVAAVRSGYPQAEIVLLRGGMANGATNENLRAAWDRAVGACERRDHRVHAFVFRHWSRQHPRVGDDQAMADELVAWLRRQKFMPPAG